MDEFKPNSNRYKELQKQTAENPNAAEKKKVISGTAKIKKKSEVAKLRDAFIAEDATKIKQYVVMDMIFPRIKSLIVDTLIGVIKMAAYGERSSGSHKSSVGDTVSWRDYNNAGRKDNTSTSYSRNAANLDDVIFGSRSDGEAVLNYLDEMIDRYGKATVIDFYEAAELTAPSFVSARYGWRNISNAKVVGVKDGWVIDMPRAIVLD